MSEDLAETIKEIVESEGFWLDSGTRLRIGFMGGQLSL